jgi:hypothetical protein
MYYLFYLHDPAFLLGIGLPSLGSIGGADILIETE